MTAEHSDTETDDFRRGAALFARLAPEGASPPWVAFEDVTPLLGRQTAYAFGTIIARPGLDLRTREIATVCMLAVLGGSEAQVTFHTGAALRAGANAPEIVEALTQVSVYAGIPRALNAAAAARQAFADNGVSATAPAPRAVVTELLSRLVGGDPAGAAELLADDVTVTVLGAHTGMPWSGVEGVRKLLSLARGASLEDVEFGDPLAARDTVYVPGAVRHPVGGGHGADFVIEIVVQQGRVTQVRLYGDVIGATEPAVAVNGAQTIGAGE
jgi:4-carboxymuconolactone decarboxylase